MVRWSKWEIVDETPWQDQALETIKEMKEDDEIEKKTSQYKTKMKYGKIRDPMRPLFIIMKREKLKEVL